MKRLNITHRLAAIFCLLAVVLVVVGWRGISHLRELNAQMQKIVYDQAMQQSQGDFANDQQSFLLMLSGAGLIAVAFAIFTVMRLSREIAIRHRAEQSLRQAHEQLEQRVLERTRELVAAQKVATQEAARFQFIFGSVPVGISWMIRGEPATRIVNPAHARITGVSKENSRKMELYPLATHPDDRGKQDEMHRKLQNGEIDHYTMEKRYVRADGAICWASLTVRLFHDQENSRIEEISTLIDITELKMAEAGLAQTSGMMETLLANVPDTIYFKNLQSQYVRVSRSKDEESLELLRARHESAHPAESLPAHLAGLEQMRHWLVGKTDFDIFPEERARPAYEEEQEIIHTSRSILSRIEHGIQADGQDIWLITTKMAWRNKDGDIIGTFGMSKNITDIKKAELVLEDVHKELLEASRRAGMAEVATSVLHNVGNVLNSVNVSATMVSDQMRNSRVGNLAKVNALLREHAADLGNFLIQDAQGRQIPAFLNTLAGHLGAERETMLSELESLRKNIDHIKDIVAMQQNYSKVSGISETLPVVDLLEDALRINAGAFNRHDVNVVRDYQARPSITVEKHKVLQILVNIMRNAKYACDESGREDKQMRVRISNGEGRVKIAVIDNGVGILPENLTRIFAHGFTTRKEGHGFGLHSGALAAKELNGSLTASSDGLNKGATFVLELPLNPEHLMQ